MRRVSKSFVNPVEGNVAEILVDASQIELGPDIRTVLLVLVLLDGRGEHDVQFGRRERLVTVART